MELLLFVIGLVVVVATVRKAVLRSHKLNELAQNVNALDERSREVVRLSDLVVQQLSAGKNRDQKQEIALTTTSFLEYEVANELDRVTKDFDSDYHLKSPFSKQHSDVFDLLTVYYEGQNTHSENLKYLLDDDYWEECFDGKSSRRKLSVENASVRGIKRKSPGKSSDHLQSNFGQIGSYAVS